MQLFLAAFLTAAQGQIPFGTLAGGGLSGSPAQLTADVLPDKVLALGLSGMIGWPERGGSACMAELAACVGLSGLFEAGVAVPAWFSDDSWESDHIPGDITLAAKYLYDQARGGTALSFTGRLRLPTGSAPRDRGSEAAVGFCTSTTYRLMRFSASVEYALSGAENPFEARLNDRGYFGCGGTSFLTADLEAFAGLSGCTTGSMAADAGLLFCPFEGSFLWLEGKAALQGGDGYSLRAGVSTTRQLQ